MNKMKLINDTLSMAFLAVIAASAVALPIISIVENKKSQNEMVKAQKELIDAIKKKY